MKDLFKTLAILAGCAALSALLAACGEPSSQAQETSPGAGPHGGPAGAAALEGGVPVAAPAPPAASASTDDDASPAPRPAPRETATASAAGLRVRRLVVARDVEAREPVGAGRRFARDGEPLFAFFEVASTSRDQQEVVVTFEQDDGTSVGHVRLEVPPRAPRYRTWALSHNVNRAGDWRAVVRTAEGELLAEAPFEVI